MMSREVLIKEARSNACKPEMLEKVYQLLKVLGQISQIVFLKNRLVLKGGTALNLFHFDHVPRLSIDIDLNYIGKLDRAEMLKEKPLIDDAIEKILLQNQFQLDRKPNRHAGGKSIWRYPSVLGQMGNLEIDLNYMYRHPLLPIKYQSPKMKNITGFEFPVLDIHELAAGKLSALLNRTVSRDLFDVHYLLTNTVLDEKYLRFAFVVYIAMTKLPVNSISRQSVSFDPVELHNKLLPVLIQSEYLPRKKADIKAWGIKLQSGLQEKLNIVLPLTQDEIKFISLIRDAGNIDASLITDDIALQKIVETHPAVLWAAKRAE